MPLPFSRERTYNDDTPVDPNDLNAIQDSIAAEHNRPLHFGAASWQILGDPSNYGFDFAGALMTSVIATGAKNAVIDITPWLIPGDTIKEFVAHWKNGATPAAGSIQFTLSRTPHATLNDTTVAAGPAEDTNTGAAGAVRSATVGVGHEVLPDNAYGLVMEMDGTAGDDQAGFAGVTIILEEP